MIDNHKLEAVISMPSGIFEPYAGDSTGILIFIKTEVGETDRMWFYDMEADGYSLDDKREPIKENDIPDIITRFNNLAVENDRKRNEKSFFVPVEEIRDNGYDLSINKYKEIEYEKQEYKEPEQIINDIFKLEEEIIEGLSDLKKIIDGVQS